MSTHLPKLHRINAVAKMLGLSRPTIYRLVHAGELTLVKLGESASAITEDSIRNFIASRLPEGGDPAANAAAGENSIPTHAEELQARSVDPFGMSKSHSNPKRRRELLKPANPEIDRLEYALSKHVVDMERCGFTILTTYGALRIDAEDAPRVAQAVRAILKGQLKRAEVGHG